MRVMGEVRRYILSTTGRVPPILAKTSQADWKRIPDVEIDSGPL